MIRREKISGADLKLSLLLLVGPFAAPVNDGPMPMAGERGHASCCPVEFCPSLQWRSSVADMKATHGILCCEFATCSLAPGW